MVHLPPETNVFEFVRVAALRAAQLMRGCRPRVTASHRPSITAQLEIAAGKVQAEPRLPKIL
jgi:DNA-directed RNA polymerase subunit K/omega